MRSSNIIFAAVLLIVAVSCQKEAQKEKIRVDFQAGLSGFVTKATDTSFESGDSIALSSTGGLKLSGMPLVFGATGFKAAETLYWDNDNAVAASFSAVYPFSATSCLAVPDSIFTVHADQSSHHAYTSSDIMMARCTAAFGTGTVTLPFRHLLCQYAVCIDNKLDDNVKEVYISGVQGASRISMKDFGKAEATGARGTVKACHCTLGDGTDAWIALLPAQEADITIAVITDGGRQFKYTTGPFRVDESGVQIRFKMVLSALSLGGSIEPFVTGWTIPLSQDSSSLPELTLAQYNAVPESERTVSRISGAIGNVTDSVAGVFSITDSSDTVEVEALLSPACEPSVQFADANLKEGDYIRVYGDGRFVYINHAVYVNPQFQSGETGLWSGIFDLNSWTATFRPDASIFASVKAGDTIRIRIRGVFDNFWSLKLYSGITMSPLAISSQTGSAEIAYSDLLLTEESASVVRSESIAIRGNGVLGSVAIINN